ncbi:hypothetical protein THTE_1705 [Thermogutta terrifontis]|uniref:Uncharacterized protein n=1 Tax=Thermogutta terrifontis TaxID=1331910 RepID=A0A286RED4_9BACT|nr:hypothetical protein THTE_1705 [Thermogutta terrifontis]
MEHPFHRAGPNWLVAWFVKRQGQFKNCPYYTLCPRYVIGFCKNGVGYKQTCLAGAVKIRQHSTRGNVFLTLVMVTEHHGGLHRQIKTKDL